jgi:RNA polymerase sigma-70 factor (ECF subfamily)
MDSTPATLLEQVRHPDNRQAWEQFVRLYTPLILGFARRHGLQDADAADLAQEVFAALVRAMPHFQYDPNRSFRAWLGALVCNRWRDRQRGKLPLPLADDDPAWNRLLVESQTEAFDENEYQTVLISRGLAIVRVEFSAAIWALFEATVLEGSTIAAAATRFGVTPNAIYLARSRVLRRVKEVLTGFLEK